MYDSSHKGGTDKYLLFESPLSLSVVSAGQGGMLAADIGDLWGYSGMLDSERK